MNIDEAKQSLTKPVVLLPETKPYTDHNGNHLKEDIVIDHGLFIAWYDEKHGLLIGTADKNNSYSKTWIIDPKHIDFKNEVDRVLAQNKEITLTYQGVNITISHFHSVEPHQAIAQFIHSQNEEIKNLKQQLSEVHKSRASWIEYIQKIESGEFVLVPKEPTLQMLKLADKHVMDCSATPESAYKVMIKASQQPTNLIDSFIADGGFDKAMGGKNGE